MIQFVNRESPVWANSLADGERLAIEWLLWGLVPKSAARIILTDFSKWPQPLAMIVQVWMFGPKCHTRPLLSLHAVSPAGSYTMLYKSVVIRPAV